MLVRKKDTDELLALKTLKKIKVKQRNGMNRTNLEKKILETIEHPFIVSLKYAFQTPTKLYMAMEWCPAGELYFHIIRHKRLPEMRARFYVCQLVLALDHLHKNKII